MNPNSVLRLRSPLVPALLGALLAGCGGGGGGGRSLTAIEVTPFVPNLAAGTSTPMRATGIYSDSTAEDITEDVTWSSSDGTVLSVDDTPGMRGYAQALIVGSADVTAELGGTSGTTTVTVTAATLTGLQVVPNDPSIASGTSQVFSATGLFSDGSKQDLTAAATWTSSDTGVATMGATPGAEGLATSLATGPTTITASFGGMMATSDLTVTAAVLVTLEVSPTLPKIARGTSLQLFATGIYSDGTKQDVTDLVTWSSDATGVATVSNAGDAGAVSGAGTGSATITAQLAAVSGTTSLAVTAATLSSLSVTPSSPAIPLGLSGSLHATGLFSDGTKQDLTDQVLWSSSDGAVTMVSNAAGSHGVATSVATGTATVTAQLDGVTGFTSFQVTAATLFFVGVTPVTPALPLGTELQLVATGTYTDLSTHDITAEVVWDSSDTGVAVISNAPGSEGVAVNLASGPVTMTATLNGVSGSTIVTCTPATLTSIDVTPPAPDLPLGFLQQLTATGTYSDGTKLDITLAVTWSSASTAVATVSNAGGSEGLSTSVSVGNTMVSATLGAVTGSTTLFVSARILTSIDIFITSTEIPLGFEESLQATGFYSDGSSEDLTAQVTWSSSDTGVAVVSNDPGTEGLVDTIATGMVTITATFGSVAGLSDIEVTSAVIVSLDLSPLSPAIPVGSAEQFTATATYSDGSVLDVTALATWSTANVMVATASNASRSEGLVSGTSAGTTTVTADFDGLSTNTDLTVNNVTLSSIVVTPVDPSIALSTLIQFTATGTYSDMSTADLTVLATWGSSDTGVASISNAAGTEGQALGEGIGTATITATFDGASDSTSLTVADLTLLSIAILPADATVVEQETVAYTAIGTYNDGSMQDITTSVSWKSSDNQVATIGGSAKAVAHKAGTCNITATLDMVVGTTTLTVTL